MEFLKRGLKAKKKAFKFSIYLYFIVLKDLQKRIPRKAKHQHFLRISIQIPRQICIRKYIRPHLF